jgi:hypothetical protein
LVIFVVQTPVYAGDGVRPRIAGSRRVADLVRTPAFDVSSALLRVPPQSTAAHMLGLLARLDGLQIPFARPAISSCCPSRGTCRRRRRSRRRIRTVGSTLCHPISFIKFQHAILLVFGRVVAGVPGDGARDRRQHTLRP